MLSVAGELINALSRLEALLDRAGAAIVPVLHQGIGESEVVSLLDGVGLALTSEIVTWFGWHDGAGERGMPSMVIELVPGGEFYGLAYLCGECAETKDNSEAVAAMSGGVLAEIFPARSHRHRRSQQRGSRACNSCPGSFGFLRWLVERPATPEG